jgi:NDP-sugar pyrophosphorylase family protein
MNSFLLRLAHINGEFSERNRNRININSIDPKQKYTLVEDDCCKINASNGYLVLYRIKSLIDFGDIKANTLGGFVESYNNLAQYGNCWIYNNAKVYGNALVCDNAKIKNLAQVSDNSLIKDNVIIMDKALIFGNSIIYENANIIDEFLGRNLNIGGSETWGKRCEICGEFQCEHLDRYYNSMRINSRTLIGDQFG